jgi:hypothetical protein
MTKPNNMKKILMSCSLVLALSVGSLAQDGQEAKEYAGTITNDDLYGHLSIIASDAMQGREAAKVGQKMAAAYIAAQFQKLGLSGPVKGGDNKGFLQEVVLYTSKPGDIYINSGKEKISNDYNNLVYYGTGETSGEINEEIVFAGAGTEESFEGLDVKGKGVLVVVDNTRAWRGPAKIAKEKGATNLYAINTSSDEGFSTYGKQMEHYLSAGSLSVKKPQAGGTSVFFLKPSVAANLMGSDIETIRSVAKGESKKKIKNAKVSIKVSFDIQTISSENVLGYLEGTDKKDELVVVTAHYDHVGMNDGQIYNGADDDGSGTVAVLELAEAFVKAKADGKGPRRSILFMTVTGEEKGLLGSEYYAANPVFPLKNTVVDLNIDMIGRVDPEHKDNPEYVYLVGSDRLSTELHDISEKVNDTFSKLDLDYTYNDESHPDRIYYRSDHWNFAKNNVPIIFYFNGVHEDYHKPTDTVDKINFDMLRKRAELVFYTAWVLANRDQRIVVDKIQDQTVGSN